MVSSAQLDLFKKLQSKSLGVQDPSTLINIILSEVFEKASSIELSYVFVSVIFVEADRSLKQSLFLDEYSIKQRGVIATSRV